METKARRKGIHEKLQDVIEKHGEKSPVVAAIRAAILALLVTAPLWIGIGVVFAGLDLQTDEVYAQQEREHDSVAAMQP